MKVGFWNIRTMAAKTKATQVMKEMEESNVEICGVNVCQWWQADEKQLNIENKVIIYSQKQNGYHSEGVKLIISKAEKLLVDW